MMSGWVATRKQLRSASRETRRMFKILSSWDDENPFDLKVDKDTADIEPLRNIVTGVVLPEKVANRLRNSLSIGHRGMLRFITSSLDSDKVSFGEPLSKLKIEKCETTIKRSLIASNEEVINLSTDQDLFGRLLVVAKREINLKEILSYELCCVPVSLVHPDGIVRETTKSSLMAILEKDIDSSVSLPVLSKKNNGSH